ncbi:YebC/PmpR family DNA-binding transcriptional regulator [bacterium]|nr:YebC/PmpR family DNA-binding transcriptional regulator [bacterium]
MSGHSKWSTIKRKKGALDAKRGQAFSKLSRMVTIAAKEGGLDPEMNFKLRLAIDKAKEMNMPLANIDRAIQGANKDGANIEEILYEAYGPSGVALLINAVTDNKNRSASDIKAVLNKYNGSLGSPGSVAWMFEQKGVISVETPNDKKEDLELLAIDLGAEDISDEGSSVEVYTTPDNLHKVSKGIKEAGFNVVSESFIMDPKNTVLIDDEHKASSIIKIMEALEDLDDVDEVHANFDIPQDILEKIS